MKNVWDGSERMKYLSYNKVWANRYFWRTKQQQETDYWEETDGVLHAVEIKWNPKTKASVQAKFKATYPDYVFHVVKPDNIEDFVTK